MAGIIPNPDAGSVTIRDDGGTCLTPAGVSNAWCPPASFTTSCEVAALPDGCTSRIQAKQINAFMSELLALGYKLNPNGNWNCDSVLNLASLFEQWAAGSYGVSMNKRMQVHLCNTTAMTQAFLDDTPAAAFLMCDGNGNVQRYLGRPLTSALSIAAAFCDDPVAVANLAECMPDTSITDNQLFWDIANSRFTSIVTENGIDHDAHLVVPLSELQCGDRAIARDAITGELRQKIIRPSARYKRTSQTITHAEVSGAAVDALVGQDLVNMSITSTPFVDDHLNCYPQHELIQSTRAGAWRMIIGMPGDHWDIGFDQPTGQSNNQFLNPALQFMNARLSGAAVHQFAQQQGTGNQQLAGGVPYDLSLRVHFNPGIYTPHPQNSLIGYGHVLTLTRREIVGAP